MRAVGEPPHLRRAQALFPIRNGRFRGREFGAPEIRRPQNANSLEDSQFPRAHLLCKIHVDPHAKRPPQPGQWSRDHVPLLAYMESSGITGGGGQRQGPHGSGASPQRPNKARKARLNKRGMLNCMVATLLANIRSDGLVTRRK